MAAGDVLARFLPPGPGEGRYANEAPIDQRNFNKFWQFRSQPGLLQNIEKVFQDTLFKAGAIPSLAGNAFTVVLKWATPATTGVVKWGVSLERDNSGSDISTDRYGAEVTATGNVPGTAMQIVVTSIALNALGGLAAGDTYRLKVRRLGTDAADTLVGDAYLYAVDITDL